MHTSRGPTRPRLLALALILAFFPALLFYLLVLQLPFYSYSRLALAALSLPVFAWPMYLALSRPGAASWQRWILIGLGSAVLALFGLQAISFFPGWLYPFYEKHTLTLTAPSTGFEIRGFKTSLGPVGYSSFQNLENWEKRGGRLIPLSKKAGPLQWSGWTGDSVRLDVSGEPGTALELTWDGRKQIYEIQPDEQGVFSITQRVSMPGWGKILLYFVLVLGLSYIVSLFSFIGVEKPGSDLESVPWPWRIALSAVALIGLGILVLGIYLRVHPAFLFPDRDSGFFMYSGRLV
ncbi:MAG TPA: hypothetical protein VIU39_13045, partial [Anaerolineales bacterium]